MKKTSLVSLCLVVLISLSYARAAARREPTKQAAAQTAAVPEKGRTHTLLPDGRVLVLGGMSDAGEIEPKAFIEGPGPGQNAVLSSALNFPRAGHSATVLPDGTIFIFGGLGRDGAIVAVPELFDPVASRFTILTDVVAVPRAFHSATLLTDGSLLLAGGAVAGGDLPDDVQLWDFRSHKAQSFHALLMTPRQGHTSLLLSDGSVRISGGEDRFGRPVTTDEIFDPATKRFRYAGDGTDRDQALPPRLAATLPEDGAGGVSIQPVIAVRFSRILSVGSVNDRNFVLHGPGDAVVRAGVTAAEGGRLAFLIPAAPLQPGASYTVRIADAVDTSGSAINASFSFSTEGEPVEQGSADFLPEVSGPRSSGESTTRWQQLPALQAAPGETALSGQALKLNGWPLENVTLEIDGHKTRTDSTGRFLLKGVTAGHHVLWIDGGAATQGSAAYGVYEVGATLQPGKTSVLNYTIWMTRLDTANAFNLPSPTTKETVITNPHLPGLELRLPPNTVITDRHGKVVRQVTITPVPIDKPPFPLPGGVNVPIYFTIQPGGSYISVQNASGGKTGARLIYPNGMNFTPGTILEFWNYDADALGWFVYGHGTVSPDAVRVVPDPGVEIYEFTGAMVAGGGAGNQGCIAGNCPKRADPVSLATGQFVYSKTDLALPDTLPISLTRTYVTNDSRSRNFGIGAMHAYDIFMIGDRLPYTYQELILPNGGRIRFDRISAGTGFADAVYIHTTSQTEYYGAVLTWTTDPILEWKIVLRDGTVLNFPSSESSTNPNCQGVTRITDRYGNFIKLDRTPPSNCTLTKITSPNGRTISLSYDTQGRVTQAVDNTGRTVQYTYDAAGRLATVTDVAGGVTTYAYDDQNRMTTITDARGILYLTNVYDSAGRVIQQTQADGGSWLFNWTDTGTANATQVRSFGGTTTTGGGSVAFYNSGCYGAGGFGRANASCSGGYMPQIAQVDVTDPRGYVERMVFGSFGYPVSDIHALGQPEQQTVTYSYYADNLLQSATDPLGRVSSFDYDSQGHTVRVTNLDGTASAVTSTFSYNGPFGQLTSATDPLGHASTFSYDLQGSLTTAADPLHHQAQFAYGSQGRVASATDALGNITQFSYFGGDPAGVQDPLGNVSRQLADAAGRVVSTLDAQGHTSRLQYNSLNLLTQTTDPQGHTTQFVYDPNGNLLSLTDPLNHATAYTYDNMDRVVTRTDPLLRAESFTYDHNGNLTSHTDRKGQVTTLTYDPLNRLKFAGFGTVVNQGVASYQSTISYTYDAGNRVTQAVDSAGGTITEVYDNLDRLTSETTAQGSISYVYDSAGRRTSMTVAGQPAVNYSYDAASRMTQITQGLTTTVFSYDNGDRRTLLTLPNGVTTAYSFDQNSRLTGLTYQFGTGTLGNLTYAYDVLGRRIQMGGSFARTGLPGTVASATYDSANELTNWNGTSIAYDSNGNVLSDGSNVFTWNARNQVAMLNSASLQYDATGRRTKNAAGTSFLYNGANAVQELSGTTVTANLLGGRIDEFFTRSDSHGTVVPIIDALGSVLGLADASGNIMTSYSYDPFGNTTVSGTASTNPSQYTGRENEGNGLYFLRARYYSPLLGRFVNEDPLGFAGSGPNFYAYVFDSPTNLVDPFGLEGEWWNPHSYDVSHYNPWDTVQDVGNVAEAFTDAITFGSASRLNDALGAGGMVNRCGIGHKLGTGAGIVASIPLGGEALPAGLKWLSNGAKGAIGEGLSIAKNALSGSTLVGRQINAARLGLEGLTTVFDSVWDSSSGARYFVESKLGTAGLTAAQRAAAVALGDAYRVEQWTYPFFGGAGNLLGGAAGVGGAMAGRSCSCQ